MHVSVRFRRGREEIRAGRGMKGWREAETAAIAVVRPALTHHTQVVSAASLCEGPVERNLLKPYTQSPSVLFTLLGLGTRFGSGMLLIPSRTIFLESRDRNGPMGCYKEDLPEAGELQEHHKTAGVRDVQLSTL